MERIKILPPDDVINELILSYESGMEDASEHARFGVFMYWLNKDIDSKTLSSLFKVALLDPDEPMAGSLIKEILAHELSTAHQLSEAIEKIISSKYYYSTEEELIECFTSKVGPY